MWAELSEKSVTFGLLLIARPVAEEEEMESHEGEDEQDLKRESDKASLRSKTLAQR